LTSRKIRTKKAKDREVYGEPITRHELTTEKMQNPPKDSQDCHRHQDAQHQEEEFFVE
jgi:hypothetical protein